MDNVNINAMDSTMEEIGSQNVEAPHNKKKVIKTIVLTTGIVVSLAWVGILVYKDIAKAAYYMTKILI